ncbi:MAG: acetyl-CoA C-acetyltransferase [Chloroflexi bacterium]|nr:MAG: acetyl-CoA C-acetyltransferase [Chloroflexota bacterium]MBA4374746.1 acetyl-CoA acetyltransferase [Anaerolinea sp.]
MREVAVIGIGQTKIDEHWEKSLRELASDAALAALLDSRLQKVDAIYVGNMMSGSANHQQHLGVYVADWIGMRYAEAFRLEAACSSGAASFRTAVMAVASGQVDTALAVGVEKMTDSPGNEITAELATAADADWEADQGLSFVALNALIMRRYMHEYGWKKEDFAPFAVNAHANAMHNPFARFHEPTTIEDYLKASMIADPINLMDASAIGDGAAAAVVVPLELFKSDSHKIVRVAASSAATDTIAIDHRKNPLWLKAAAESGKKAYAQAGISAADVDVFELHDAFSIMAVLSLEANGFAERGQGPRLALDGEILPTGRIPIATRGGLKARGHPVGATGMYQIVEVIQQLRGEAYGSLVEGARIGMSQNIGGSGSNIITHIFQTP